MSFGMSSALYWLSASVLTMMSAPARRRGVESGDEAARQALVRSEVDDVIHAARPRDLDRAVACCRH